MKYLSDQEKKALELMQKDNFRGISKENVMQLMSILDKVDPEMAKKIITQMPEVIRDVVECEKAYANILARGMDSFDASTASCFVTEDEIVKSLQKEIDKDDTTFEQKQYYFEKMAEAAERKERKDTEHKDQIRTVLKYGGELILAGIFFFFFIFYGSTNNSSS